VEQHQVDRLVLVRVAAGDLVEVRGQDGVAGDVDAVAAGEVGGGGRRGGGGVAEFEHVAVGGGDLPVVFSWYIVARKKMYVRGKGDVYRPRELVQRLQDAPRHMRARHRGDPHPWLPVHARVRVGRTHHRVVVVARRPLAHVNEHLLEHVEREHVRKGLPGSSLSRQLGLAVGGRDDGQVAPEGGFDSVVEVVALFVYLVSRSFNTKYLLGTRDIRTYP